MTLKELRISKGLTQGECAEYLGMSTRNYQNYENDPDKVNTTRYNNIFHRLENYGKNTASSVIRNSEEYYTSVVTGSALNALAKTVDKYQKRDSEGLPDWLGW